MIRFLFNQLFQVKMLSALKKQCTPLKEKKYICVMPIRGMEEHFEDPLAFA